MKEVCSVRAVTGGDRRRWQAIAAWGAPVLGAALAVLLLPALLEWCAARTDADQDGIVAARSRSLLAEYSYRKAKDYFHSGALPTMFDGLRQQDIDEAAHMQTNHIQVKPDHWLSLSPQHGPPIDWLDRFGRNFYPTRHTHLNDGGAMRGESRVREIMPWLWFTVELDPHHLDSYLEAAFWLRRDGGNNRAAEEMLRHGLRSNRNSYQILFELGTIYREDRRDARLARIFWEDALRKWAEQKTVKEQPDEFVGRQITTHLALLEEEQGNYDGAIGHLAGLREISKESQSIEKWIANLRARQQGLPIKSE